jgi:hydroxymethylbilane synthase
LTERLKVGTRRSRLARAQTERVLRRLRRAVPDLKFEPVPIETSGDRTTAPEGSTDFTDAIDRALLLGTVDLAVHSAKDLPSVLDRRFVLAACPRRGDPRDCLVVAPGLSASRLPKGARVGSSSPRRRAQLLRWRRDLEVVPLRGNVDTRLERVRARTVDAAVLAVAGLVRLRRGATIGTRLQPQQFLPAPGQGTLAIVTRAGDRSLVQRLGAVNDRTTHECLTAERALAAELGGSCHVPMGALATIRPDGLALEGEVLDPDGHATVRMRRVGDRGAPAELGVAVARGLRVLGADELIGRSGP